VPTACQLEFWPLLLRAARKNTWLPAKLGVKMMARVRVSVLPLALTELPLPPIKHWSLDTLPEPGSTIPEYGPPASPASSTRSTTPEAAPDGTKAT